MNIRKDADSLDPTADNPSGESPRNQFYIRSSMDLPRHLQHDVTLRYVDRLPALNIPSYFSLDTHLGWHPVTTFEIYFTGQNLLNDQHLEFIPELINTVPTEVSRTFSAGVRWTF